MNDGPELVELNICNGCKYLARMSSDKVPYCHHQALKEKWKFLARPENTWNKEQVILTPTWCPILSEVK